MESHNQTRIQIQPNYSLADALIELDRGDIRVPGFQRDYVWKPQKIVNLFDSIVKQYPIGTIFLWKAHYKYNNLIRNMESIFSHHLPDEKQPYLFILDGQQRLISLYVAAKGKKIGSYDYEEIVADLSCNPYVDKKDSYFFNKKPDDKRYISVNKLINGDSSFLLQLAEHSKEYANNFAKYQTILRQYPLSVVKVLDVDLEDAIEIFERINTEGKPLSRFDLVAATLFTENFELSKRVTEDIQKPLKNEGFGEISGGTITQTLALNLLGSASTNAQFSLDKQEVQSTWEKQVRSIHSTVNLLKLIGVTIADFLPYDAMIPMISNYYYSVESPDKKRQVDEIFKWFWSVSFNERYSTSSPTRITEDSKWIRSLEETPSSFNRKPTIDLNQILKLNLGSRGSAARNGILSLLISQNPIHLSNGLPINITPPDCKFVGKEHYYKIFPEKIIGKSHGGKMMNFAFFPIEVHEKYKFNERSPKDYMSQLKSELGDETFSKVMYSHLVPVDDESGIWTDDYELFFKQRGQVVLAEIYRRAGILSEVASGNEYPVISKVEIALRDFIHNQMKSIYNTDNYWNKMPSPVASKLDNSSPNLRERLNNANPGDYWKIIETFVSLLPVSTTKESKNLRIEFEKYGRVHLGGWQDYRNAIMHIREADDYVHHSAMAALMWLSYVLDLDLTSYGINKKIKRN